MWFLQPDILLRMLAACVIMALAGIAAKKWVKQTKFMIFTLIIDLILIYLVSEKLVIFYTGYVLVTYGFSVIMLKIKKWRKVWFVILCLGCSFPFFYTRATSFFSFLPYGLTMIGISYNMLKAIDAVFYVYYTEEKISFIMYANYMLFFPVITAGPIFRFRDFDYSFRNLEPLTSEILEYSIKRIIKGLFKKIVVQTVVAVVFNQIVQMEKNFCIGASLAVLSYMILYLDMSGYADIAIAIGKIIGINVPENFKKPLQSATFTQFWRNWHVTLSDWIREHIFVVLGGKPLGRIKGAMIGFFTMLFMSLWHGFSMVFLADGIINGLYLAGENLLKLTTVNRRKTKKIHYFLRCLVTNAFFAVTTLFFMLNSQQLAEVFRGFLKFW